MAELVRLKQQVIATAYAFGAIASVMGLTGVVDGDAVVEMGGVADVSLGGV